MIHILVVEDDEKLNKIVCTYLNDSGFEAKGCLNARDAYDAMYSQLYDLIISDIMMPEIDGFEFAKTVRKVNERIPILFMSAKDDLPSKQRGFRLGIDDYGKAGRSGRAGTPCARSSAQSQYRDRAQDHCRQSDAGCRRHERRGGRRGDQPDDTGI